MMMYRVVSIASSELRRNRASRAFDNGGISPDFLTIRGIPVAESRAHPSDRVFVFISKFTLLPLP